jgi:hypothetical protein
MADTLFILVGQAGVGVGAAFFDEALRRCGKVRAASLSSNSQERPMFYRDF